MAYFPCSLIRGKSKFDLEVGEMNSVTLLHSRFPVHRTRNPARGGPALGQVAGAQAASRLLSLFGAVWPWGGRLVSSAGSLLDVPISVLAPALLIIFCLLGQITYPT